MWSWDLVVARTYKNWRFWINPVKCVRKGTYTIVCIVQWFVNCTVLCLDSYPFFGYETQILFLLRNPQVRIVWWAGPVWSLCPGCFKQIRPFRTRLLIAMFFQATLVLGWNRKRQPKSSLFLDLFLNLFEVHRFYYLFLNQDYNDLFIFKNFFYLKIDQLNKIECNQCVDDGNFSCQSYIIGCV